MSLSIVGVGARTPVGLTAFTSAAAVAGSISRITDHPFMVDKAGDPFAVAMDARLGTEARTERLETMACWAIDEALTVWQAQAGQPLTVYLNLPELGPRFREAEAQQVADAVTRHLAPRCRPQVHPIPQGHAGPVAALSWAATVIRAGQATAVLIVGVDSHLDAHLLEQLDRAGRVASSSNRWGFTPGEAAGALLVVDSLTAKSLGVPVWGTVAGVGLAQEHALIGSEAACVGEGLAAAMRVAIAGAGGQAVDDIYCDINGERYRSGEFVYAALRLPGGSLSEPSLFTTAADAWGDVGAATIPLLTHIAIWTGRRGRARGPRSMIWSGSDTGLRGAIIFNPPPPEVQL